MIENESDSIALLVRLRFVDSDGQDIIPITWTDNYFSILPHQRKYVDANYKHIVKGKFGLKQELEENPKLIVEVFNNRSDMNILK